MMHRWWIFLGRRADELKPEIPRQAAGGPEDGGAGLYELARQASKPSKGEPHSHAGVRASSSWAVLPG
jgi:hypothetical protein